MNKIIKKIMAGGLTLFTAAQLYLAKPNLAHAGPEKEQVKQGELEKKVKAGGFIELDQDTRDYTTINLTGYASNLLGGFNAFGFVDFESEHGSIEDSLNPTQYYGEGRLSKPIGGGFELAGEINKGSGNPAVERVGFMRPFKIGKSTFIPRFYFYNSNGTKYQLVVSWGIPLFKDYIKLGGFFDYNVEKGKDKIVTEPAVLFKIPFIKGVYFYLQGRINDFLKGKPGGDRGVGIGVRYTIK